MRVYLMAFLVLLSCSSKEKQFNDHLSMGRCDDALIHLPQKDPMVKLANSTEQAAGTVLSYAFVGASYTAEVLWDVAGGTVMFVGLCGVPVALTAFSNGSGQGMLCFPGKMDALGAPPLGRQAIRQSRPLRCPDLKSLSRSMRSVAACYESRGGAEDLAKAEKTLQSLQSAKDFVSCLPFEKHQLLNQQLTAVQVKRASLGKSGG